VEIKTSSPVGKKGIALEDLQQQGYKALFLAVGTKRKRDLALPGGEKVVAAFGEIPDLSFMEGASLERSLKNKVKTDPDTLMTTVKGVFAGGDMINGPTSVIQAIASGRKAAISIDRYLKGEGPGYDEAEPATIGFGAIDRGMFKRRDRQAVREDGSYDEGAAVSEADRCFQCGMFPKK
jgi:NADPH-dependent glutamate synthase beta subunit-like oxidoreductase